MEYQAIFKAVEKEDLKETEKILERLVGINLSLVVNDLKQSPLMVSTLKNNFNLTALLLEFGFDSSQKDITELSPFIASAANGFDKIFELMCLYKPDKHQTNRFGGTALIPSSEKGFLKTMQLALDYGVPVNYQNRLAWSALLETVILGDGGFLYQDIIRELIEHGADPKIKDFENKSSMDYALENKQEAVIQILKNEHQDDFKSIRKLIREGSLETALFELDKKEDSLKKVYYLGYTYERLDDLIHAKQNYEQGLAQDAQFAFYLANLERKQKNVEKAIDYYDLNDQDYFKYHKSNYLRELGRHDQAIKVMNELLVMNPKRVDYKFHKANSLRTLGRHEEALKEMNEATDLMPQNILFKEHAQQSATLIKGFEI